MADPGIQVEDPWMQSNKKKPGWVKVFIAAVCV